ncbi:hypothetical protein LINPERPRIM_LOCUS36135 [Linum perenne]
MNGSSSPRLPLWVLVRVERSDLMSMKFVHPLKSRNILFIFERGRSRIGNLSNEKHLQTLNDSNDFKPSPSPTISLKPFENLQ